jgi:CheY-like chemotaxis protein
MSGSILIVEDHDKVRQALRKLLEVKFSQFEVIEARSGEEAIALTFAEDPQLIIMDITLPGMITTPTVRFTYPGQGSPIPNGQRKYETSLIGRRKK